MTRLHVNLAVEDLAASVAFYTELFAAEPTLLKADYARWMLEDPRVNFAVRTGGGPPGVAHLGLQAEDRTELEAVYERVARAGRPVLDEGETTCCYSRSTKRWVRDPDGVAWEAFLTHTTESGGEHHRHAEQPIATPSARPCCGSPSL
jgi:catechol 2,3-dioxygenase-like lactoylglutathione lyase family enzyme